MPAISQESLLPVVSAVTASLSIPLPIPSLLDDLYGQGQDEFDSYKLRPFPCEEEAISPTTLASIHFKNRCICDWTAKGYLLRVAGDRRSNPRFWDWIVGDSTIRLNKGQKHSPSLGVELDDTWVAYPKRGRCLVYVCLSGQKLE